MELLVVSHKRCWPDPSAPSGYATVGGFPLQVRALSELFDRTTLLVPVDPEPPPPGAYPLLGRGLSVRPLDPLGAGPGAARRGAILRWLPANLPRVWAAVRAAEAVHVPIPGDVGTLALFIALALRKRLYVRHCGNWTAPHTAADHLRRALMIRYAGGRRVMLATGGGPAPPAPTNPAVRWIFSTGLSEAQVAALARPRAAPAGAPRLAIACRQEKNKGVGIVIESLPHVRRRFPEATLDVVGDGRALPAFKALTEALGVTGAVRFHGRVPHEAVLEVLSGADLFCYPTASSEGFPKVVHEALACGLPVVTTPVSVLPHLMAGGGGVVLEEATPETLAAAVIGCLEDPARYQTMSAKAVETAAGFTLERWQAEIGGHLEAAWGTLRSDA